MLTESQTVATLTEAARAAEVAGDWDTALSRLDEAVARAKAEGDTRGAATALRTAGRVHFDRGNLEVAAECFEASLAVARANTHHAEVALALNGLAVVAQFRGHLEVAEKLFLESGEMAQALGNEQLAALVCQNTGIIAGMRGQGALALQRYAAAVERLRRLGDEKGTALVLTNMGITHSALGEWGAAELCYSSAYELAERLHELRVMARIDTNRADMYLKRQNYEAARQSVDRAFQISGRLGSDSGLCSAYKTYGVLYRETGRPRLAEIQLGLALKLAQTCELALLEGESYDEIARLHVQEGRSREALKALNQAHRIFAQLEARRELNDIEKRLERLEDTYMRALALMESESAESRDAFTAGRYHRVADLACRLAEAVGFGGRDLSWLRIAAYLYDMGRSTIPAQILNKPGALSAEEWEIVKLHPAAADEMVTDLGFPEDVRPTIRHHHEHWDGSGYPAGLRGEEIPILARILALADVYDALTSDRPYRPAFPPDDALTIMHGEVGRKLDPELFRLFRTIVVGGTARTAPARKDVIRA